MAHIKLLVKILSVLDSLVVCKGDTRNSQYSTRKLLVYLANGCFLQANRLLPEKGNRTLGLFSWDLLPSLQELFCWRTVGGSGGAAFCGCLSSLSPEAVTATCIAGSRIGSFLCQKIQLLSIWALSHFCDSWATSEGCVPQKAVTGQGPWKKRNQVGLTCMWFWTPENLMKTTRHQVFLLFKQ